MPYVQILWRPERLDRDKMIRTRDDIASAVASLLMETDPQHVVNEQMIDSRVEEIGPLDQIRSSVFITVFARDEIARSRAAPTITRALVEVARQSAGTDDVVVELVLTNHTSSVDYAALE
jgi:hypothetical protein